MVNDRDRNHRDDRNLLGFDHHLYRELFWDLLKGCNNKQIKNVFLIFNYFSHILN